MDAKKEIDLEKILAKIAACLEQMSAEEDSERCKSYAFELVNSSFELGQAMELKKIDIDAPHIEKVLKGVTKWTASVVLAIEKALAEGREILDKDWEADADVELANLERAYRNLSAEQFFLDLFRSTTLKEHYHYFELPPDDDDKDELVEERVEQIGALPLERIPAGIPESHWWWWAPEQPPAGGTV